MWVFTKHGFYSVAQTPEGDLMFRARSKKHLTILNRLPFFVTRPEIITTPDADYPFRIVVPQAMGCEIMSLITEEIDYSNFKKECHTTKAYPMRVLADVWDRMFNAYYGSRPKSKHNMKL